MLNLKKFNRKAAIGAAMTWVVATIIIFFLIIIFVYASYTISNEKKMKNLGSMIFFNEQSYDIDSEQILLALLQKESDSKTIKDYITEGKYDYVENKTLPILMKLSELGVGSWNLYIYENNNEVKKIKTSTSNVEILGSKNSIIYLSSNKKIEFFQG